MTTAAFAIRLATGNTSKAISINADGGVLHYFCFAGAKVLINNIATESGGRHAVDLEQAQLILINTHLGYWIINNHAKLGVEPHLKRITARAAHGIAYHRPRKQTAILR